jgi:hypothetical protein
VVHRSSEGWKYVVTSSRGSWGHLLRFHGERFEAALRRVDGTAIEGVDSDWREVSSLQARDMIDSMLIDASLECETREECEVNIDQVMEELVAVLTVHLAAEEVINLQAILAEAASSGWEPTSVVENLRTKLRNS